MVAILAAFGFWAAARRKERLILLPLFAVLLMIVLPTSRIRYLIPLLPFLFLAAGRGLLLLNRFRIRQFMVFGTVASSICIATLAYVPFAVTTAGMNFVEVGKFLNTLPESRVRIQLLPSSGKAVVGAMALVPLLDMSTSKMLCLEETEQPSQAAAAPMSPLRFTWELQLGNTYELCGMGAAHLPLVLLSDETGARIQPSDAGNQIRFSRRNDAFIFQPAVTFIPAVSNEQLVWQSNSIGIID